MSGDFKVYTITAPDGRQYVGQTRNSIKIRWAQHCFNYPDKSLAPPDRLQAAMHRYGADNLKLEVVATFDTRDAALEEERRLIFALNTLRPNGFNGNAPHSKVARDVIDLKAVVAPWPPVSAPGHCFRRAA